MLDRAATIEVLRDGDIEVVGRIIGSSNNAMFVRVTLPCPDPGEPARVLEAIHKPTAGERPLDDFPDGTLTRREVAAYLVSEATEWGIVPPTLMRDGPFGEGMIQAYIEPDPSVDVVDWINDDEPRLRRMAVFDAAVNNTDRKGGHILPVDGGRHVYGVDHGVCFSVTPKLRTVLWAWRGEPLLPDEVDGLGRIRDALDGDLGADLRSLLSRAEIRATSRRVDALLDRRRFPLPSPSWPAIPWPPY
ncbi:MAG TPA: SCO1664 family protein [Candidatus Limnocylindrales bacterium]|nr:SCO1664 family protein [Candidatus Limnocylindrales bacterium]